MSYVLTRLLALSARPGDPFSGLLDPREVGAAGQSDGGDTVAALAANTCCTDRRLKAAAVLSGAEWRASADRPWAPSHRLEGAGTGKGCCGRCAAEVVQQVITAKAGPVPAPMD